MADSKGFKYRVFWKDPENKQEHCTDGVGTMELARTMQDVTDQEGSWIEKCEVIL